MKLAISQIAWGPHEEAVIAGALQDNGVRFIELVPPRLFTNPANPTEEEILLASRFWAKHDISPIAFQSLLFGQPDLMIFASDESRGATEAYLHNIIVAAGKMGAGALVFGSPKNRFVPKGMDLREAWDIAVDIFGRLGQLAFDNGTRLCIEPNPQEYGCNFVTTAAEGLEIVRDVASAGFGLHLDLAGMWLAGDDIQNSVATSYAELRHFHLSAPELGPVVENGLPYLETINALQELGYSQAVSIEMRSGDSSNLNRVKESLSFVRGLLSDSQ